MSENDESERRMNLLIARLPHWMQTIMIWLRKPSAKFVRIPIGILLIISGFLAILPIFGLWMLPLGMIVMAQDVPLFKRWVDQWLAWVERKHPKWLGLAE